MRKPHLLNPRNGLMKIRSVPIYSREPFNAYRYHSQTLLIQIELVNFRQSEVWSP